jgi:hypothetical protein
MNGVAEKSGDGQPEHEGVFVNVVAINQGRAFDSVSPGKVKKSAAAR